MSKLSSRKDNWWEVVDPMDSPVNLAVKRAMAKLKAMTPDQFRQSLVDFGIIEQDGKLSDIYRNKD